MGFKTAWAATHAREGGYSNDPNDPGGETNHGITIRVARAYGYTGPMKDLSEAHAADIGKKAYWDNLSLDRICVLSEKLADEIFDGGYNCGQARAATWVQCSLNSLNRNQKSYLDIPVDGRVGLGTIGALVAYFKERGVEGEDVFLKTLVCQRGAYYIGIARGNPKLEEFVYGWFKTRIHL